jgi:hypothetical protein
MVLELEPERKRSEPLPVGLVELLGDLLVGRSQLGQRHPRDFGVPPAEAVLVVIAPNGAPSEASKQPDYSLGIRTLGDQISNGYEPIAFVEPRLLEEVLELFAAPMEVSDDEGALAHGPILMTFS